MTDITGRRGEMLRALIVSARKDPGRWPGFPKGLTQAQLAQRAGISQVYLRQIENAHGSAATSVSASTLAALCAECSVDPVLIRALGFADVADQMDAAMMLKTNEIPDEVINDAPGTEEYLRATPGLTPEQAELLVDVVRQLGRTEPLGTEIWTRRSARKRRRS